jgi:flagellar basal body-associated protein FliL
MLSDCPAFGEAATPSLPTARDRARARAMTPIARRVKVTVTILLSLFIISSLAAAIAAAFHFKLDTPAATEPLAQSQAANGAMLKKVEGFQPGPRNKGAVE